MNRSLRLAIASTILLAGIAQADLFRLKPIPTQAMPKPMVVTNTQLRVCAHGAGCPPSMGGWVDSVRIGPDARDMPREFLWKTDAGSLTNWRWQVSAQPFASNDADMPGIVAEGDAGSPQYGRFSINFSDIATNAPLGQRGAGKFRLRATQPTVVGLLQPRYFVRVLPVTNGRAVGTPSNMAQVEFVQATQSQPSNPLVQMPDNVYSVRLLNFERPKPASLPWGCVNITGVDMSAAGPVNKALHGLYDSFLKSGQPMCPKVYKGIGEQPWYESLWDFSSSGVNWVSGVYGGLKEYAVKAVASAINALPGNLCNPKCEQGLMAGLNAGLVALGVPPNIPNLDQLTDQGMSYLVEAAASQAGVPCDALCQGAIRTGIKDMVKEASSRTVQSYCGDVETAHRNGREPLCLPPGVRGVPAPGSANQPAQVRVRITRNPGTEHISPATAATFKLRVDFPATNMAGLGGAWSVATNTCYTDTSIFECDQEMIHTSEPLRGALFQTVHADLPTLSPGRSLDATFFLEPAAYWLPGHLELIHKKGGHVKYNDWWKLYRGAQLTVNADITCPKIVGAPIGSCTQPDVRHYGIPKTGD